MISLVREQLESLIHESFQLEQDLEALINKNYPEPKVKDFIEKELVVINRFLRQQFEIGISEIIETSTVQPEVKAAQGVWSYFVDVIRIVGNADIHSSPIEVIKVIDFWLKGAEEDDYVLMTTAMNELNYSFQEIWLPLADYLKNNFNYVRSVEHSVINLCFPTNEKDNIFLLPIYAHEIGHFLDAKKEVTHKVISTHIADIPSCVKLVVKELNGLGPVNEVVAITVILKSFLLSWVKEIVADTFGVYLAGPAFFFAGRAFDVRVIDGFASERLLEQVNGTHPSNRLRLTYRRILLKDLGYYSFTPDELKKKIDEYTNWWSQSKCLCTPIQYNMGDRSFLIQFDDESLTACEDFILSLYSTISESVNSIVDGAQFFAANLTEKVPNLISRLCNLIPPNEISNVDAHPSDILNTAWFARILYKEQIKNTVGRLNKEDYESEYEVEEIIKNLTRYAITASDVQRKWQNL